MSCSAHPLPQSPLLDLRGWGSKSKLKEGLTNDFHKTLSAVWIFCAGSLFQKYTSSSRMAASGPRAKRNSNNMACGFRCSRKLPSKRTMSSFALAFLSGCFLSLYTRISDSEVKRSDWEIYGLSSWEDTYDIFAASRCAVTRRPVSSWILPSFCQNRSTS